MTAVQIRPFNPLDILFQDNRIFVCLKPYGVVSTDEPGGLPSLVRQHLGDETACVRTVHRLDQVVGGVMVLARSRVAASVLGQQVQGKTFRKEYLAVAHGRPARDSGTLTDLLLRCKETRTTRIVTQPGKDAQEAILHYRLLGYRDGFSLLHITLETGRTHQIRAQFSGRGLPLVGDKKYGAPEQEMEGIALWSHLIAFDHPQSGTPMTFTAPPPDRWPWNLFTEDLK